MLQCRTGKRSPSAAFRIAVDQASRGLMTAATARRLVKKRYLPKKYAVPATKPVISKEEAILRISPADIERLFYPVLDPNIPREHYAGRRITEGIGAVPGAACGEIVFSAERAEARADGGNSVILVRKETSPEDVGGMYAATGILTATGGKTSHAAVVARGWGKCCIVGCDQLVVDYENQTLTANGTVLREGDFITLDGDMGQVYEGRINLVRPEAPPEYNTIMRWCDKQRRLRVRTNADTPEDARRAVELGAEGIGLCRTEHMFFDPERINAMREMILAENGEDRRRALDKLVPFQRRDFEGIFRAMEGRPVTVRLLDPPLHEFLPQHDNVDGQQAIANELGVSLETIQRRVEQLHESNPMLGHRGCRLSITYPEILDMQVRAVMEAAVACKRDRVKVRPEIMIPLSIDPKELGILVDRTRAVADATLKEHGVKIPYLVGTMVETPRAALLAAGLAGPAEFFSFGTNDLTQMTMGLSRDDAGRFLPDYVNEAKAGVFQDDPFQTLDIPGVGLLVKQAVEQGRTARPKLKLGICGEHGGDPMSIRFCEQVGLDYVSCSPLRVPIARLASAQAASSAVALGPRVLKTNSKPKSTVRPGKKRSKGTVRPKATSKRRRKKTAKRGKSKSRRA
jgi:pyruvate,orthophosphate dikinase